MRRAAICIAVILSLAGVAAAAAEDLSPHPVIPEGAGWTRYLFRIVGAMFVLAAVVGPVVRKNAPRDLPPETHSHDEPPGTSGHHGPTGTEDPGAPDRFHA